jgi:teichuronic acid biosynthesis glycosyltransferase TuaG
MKVTIITPTYNAERFIEETIHSVQSQTYRNWELLVIDDCSNDNTRLLVSKISAQDNRVHLISLAKNEGAANARNKGLENVSGEYVAFLDADDIWLPKKLEEQVNFMRSNHHCFTYTSYEIIDANGNPTGKIIDANGPTSVNYFDMLKKRATIGCSTVMIDWNKLSEYRMPSIRTGQDYALWLKILKAGNFAFCLHDTLTHYRIVPGSISRNKFKKALRQWEIYRKIEKISFYKSFWYFLNYAFRALTR